MDNPLSLIFRPEVMVFLVPISAIVGGIYLASLKIKSKALTQSLNNEEKKLLARVLEENEELKQRISNLENIVTSLDQDLLDFNKNASSQKKLGE